MLTKQIIRLKTQISNLQVLLDSGRGLQHKKYQMKNQVQFNQKYQQDARITKGLQKNEVQTRILKLLHESELIDIGQFSFSDDIRKKFYLDSLDITALVSSIQEEFNTIFDPDTYQNARSLDVIVEALINDPTIV